MAKYKVLIKIMSDQKGKKGKDGFQAERIFMPGDTIGDKDFKKSVIANWLMIGVLEKVVVEKKDKINDNENDEIKDGD